MLLQRGKMEVAIVTVRSHHASLLTLREPGADLAPHIDHAFNFNVGSCAYLNPGTGPAFLRLDAVTLGQGRDTAILDGHAHVSWTSTANRGATQDEHVISLLVWSG